MRFQGISSTLKKVVMCLGRLWLPSMAMVFTGMTLTGCNPTSNTMAQSSSALEKGLAFLKENAGKEGVQTTPSGLQYKHIVEGNGKSPSATDVVQVHYRGCLIDGTEFDSSYKRNSPIEFPLNRVIRGWTEGVQLMKEGGKIELYIPSELAYGKGGAPGAIGPNEVLFFEIELLQVK